MTLDLTDDEAAALTKQLRQTIDYDPNPLARRLDPLKSILAKLDPPKPAEPLPPLKPGMGPRVGGAAGDGDEDQLVWTRSADLGVHGVVGTAKPKGA